VPAPHQLPNAYRISLKYSSRLSAASNLAGHDYGHYQSRQEAGRPHRLATPVPPAKLSDGGGCQAYLNRLPRRRISRLTSYTSYTSSPHRDNRAFLGRSYCQTLHRDRNRLASCLTAAIFSRGNNTCAPLFIREPYLTLGMASKSGLAMPSTGDSLELQENTPTQTTGGPMAQHPSSGTERC